MRNSLNARASLSELESAKNEPVAGSAVDASLLLKLKTRPAVSGPGGW